MYRKQQQRTNAKHELDRIMISFFILRVFGRPHASYEFQSKLTASNSYSIVDFRNRKYVKKKSPKNSPIAAGTCSKQSFAVQTVDGTILIEMRQANRTADEQ